MSTVTAETTVLEDLAERYFAAWAECDPDRIVSMHTPDTIFHLHTGGGPIEGRDAVREAFASLFSTWHDFSFETNRVLLGDGHWVLDWVLVARPAGGGDEVRLGCLDVVAISPDALVSRKDTYVDAADVAAVAA